MTQDDNLAIEFRGVWYRLETGPLLLEDLNLQVRRGETLVLLGRSGSGKTTTLKLINGLLKPTQGQVLVEGRATSDADPLRLRRRIGYVIQEVGLFPNLTVERNVGLVPRLENWSSNERMPGTSAGPWALIQGASPLGIRGNCPAASGNEWGWRARWLPTRHCC